MQIHMLLLSDVYLYENCLPSERSKAIAMHCARVSSCYCDCVVGGLFCAMAPPSKVQRKTLSVEDKIRLLDLAKDNSNKISDLLSQFTIRHVD